MNSTMRRILALILILAISCLPVAAYAVPDEPESAVAGIIGGADGPTAFIVAEQSETYSIGADGAAGGTRVMTNGNYVAFWGATPERVDGTTYAPCRPLFLSIGLGTRYDAETRTVIAERSDMTVRLPVGGTEMTISLGGKDEVVDIKAAPYLKDGNAYIPVRAVLEALGCDVYWDAASNTVVVLEKAYIISGIDKNITVANKLLTMRLDAMKITAETTLEIKTHDEEYGDFEISSSMDVTYLTDGRNASVSATLDLAELLTLLTVAIPEAGGTPFDVSGISEETQQVIDALKGVKLDAILNADDGVAYIKPTLPGEEGTPNGLWIKLEDIAFFGGLLNGMTIGEFVYANSSSFREHDQIQLHNEIMRQARIFSAMLSDSYFEKNGNSYTISLEENGGNILIIVFGIIGRVGSRFDVVFTIKTDGNVITGVTGDIDIYIDEYFGTQITLTGSVKSEAYTGEIPKAPPKGEPVVSYEELIS